MASEVHCEIVLLLLEVKRAALQTIDSYGLFYFVGLGLAYITRIIGSLVVGWPRTAISVGCFVTYELGVDAGMGHRGVVPIAPHYVVVLRYDLEAGASTSFLRANYGLTIAEGGLELGTIIVHDMVEAEVISYLPRMGII